jgi:YfiH family protein
MLKPLHAENLQSLSGLRHGFFTREGGVSTGMYASLDCGFSDRDPAQVIENRRRVAEHLGTKPDNLLSCFQIHSPDVVTVSAIWKTENRPEADAMVTKERGIALGVLTADCGPVLFVDPKASVIGAAHAGWRGALSGVIENTIAAMEKLGAARRSIQAAIGPCIGQQSYEVGPEFPAPFLAENPDHARFFRPAFKSDHTMFNLPGYIEAKLHTLGLASVEPSPADTLADETRFFSYRRACLKGEKRTGSLIAAIVLESDC